VKLYSWGANNAISRTYSKRKTIAGRSATKHKKVARENTNALQAAWILACRALLLMFMILRFD
jgi:hypothetical protein